jgi:hypothetical protein
MAGFLFRLETKDGVPAEVPLAPGGGVETDPHRWEHLHS